MIGLRTPQLVFDGPLIDPNRPYVSTILLIVKNSCVLDSVLSHNDIKCPCLLAPYPTPLLDQIPSRRRDVF